MVINNFFYTTTKHEVLIHVNNNVKTFKGVKIMKIISVFIMVFVFITTTFALDMTVNKSITIRSGEHTSGGCSSVNGRILIEEGAHIRGTCKTVNGSIKIEQDCQVNAIKTVNGSIRVDENTKVKTEVESVNGSIELQDGVYVGGNLQTVNGSIKITGTEVNRDITTYNGSVSLYRKSVVHDDIIIKDNKGNNHRRRPLEIIIDNSTVEGDIINKEEDIEVIVYLRDGGEVNGRIINAEIVEQ